MSYFRIISVAKIASGNEDAGLAPGGLSLVGDKDFFSFLRVVHTDFGTHMVGIGCCSHGGKVAEVRDVWMYRVSFLSCP